MDVFNCLKGSWCISRCRGDTASPGFTLGNQHFGYYVAKTLTDGAFAKILFARILAQGKSYVWNQISWTKGGSPDRDGPPHSKGPCSNIFIWIVWDSSTPLLCSVLAVHLALLLCDNPICKFHRNRLFQATDKTSPNSLNCLQKTAPLDFSTYNLINFVAGTSWESLR